MLVRSYRYSGSKRIAQATAGQSEGSPIRSVADVERWIQETHQQPDPWGLIVATVVITEDGILRLADRHSEQVACAGGQALRSAGELGLAFGKNGWEVHVVSNPSTGYCPEPTSWPAVADALEAIPLPHPARFTEAYLFRRSPACHQLNLIQDEVFACAVGDGELPAGWNCASGEEADQSSPFLRRLTWILHDSALFGVGRTLLSGRVPLVGLPGIDHRRTRSPGEIYPSASV